jgi:hypothetical protein
MQHIVHINARVQRIEADKQNRSDAINRNLTGANREIIKLRSQLFAARVMAGTASGTVMLLTMLLAKHVLGGA